MLKAAEELFSEETILYMREKITANSGHEVFFAGYTDEESGKVTEVEAVVFGNRNMTPVLLEKALQCDVVIHNHPSSNLTPSNEDLYLADNLMNQGGISFLIVDSKVKEVKIVYYAPDIKQKPRQELSKEEVLKLFEADGNLAKSMPYFEKREAQEVMTERVVEAFNNNQTAIIEAGTGTGKSLAYLIPSILWAKANKEKIIISTYTKNLQQQLVEKDLPAVKEALGIAFTYNLVKGKSNYLCKKRYYESLQGLKTVKKESIFSELDFENLELLEELSDWVNKTEEGDLDELPYEVLRAIREEVEAKSDLCLHRKCAFYESCFVNINKQKVFKSDLIIANHHYLAGELALEYAEVPARILPRFTKVVIDEAHNFKKAVLSYLEENASYFGLLRILNKLYNSSKSRKAGDLNLLSSFLAKVNSKEAGNLLKVIEEELAPAIPIFKEQIRVFFHNLKDIITPLLKPHENSIRIKGSFHRNMESLKEEYSLLTDSTESLEGWFEKISECFKKMPESFRKDKEILMKKIERGKNQFFETLEILEYLFTEPPDEVALWISISQNDNLTLNRVSLDVSDFLNKTLYNQEYSLVFTSATLAINNSFNDFRNDICLTSNQLVLTEILPSPFNYREQCRLLIPSDIPEPKGSDFGESGFMKASLPFIKDLLERSNGGAFILCTSYGQIKQIKNYLFHQNLPYPIYVHGENNRSVLLNAFRTSMNGVLLGTDSFWEGVDIQGDALRLVIIVKLPFRPPTDPVTETMYELIEKRGENAFQKLAIPDAVLKLKQGFGRLIRSREDQGVISILDRRIMEKSYGKIFLNSLPVEKEALFYKESDELLAVAEKFYLKNRKKHVKKIKA